MELADKVGKPTRYIIQVQGHLDALWENWFEEMKITNTEDGVMILSGELMDQCALHGLLEKIHSLNLILISVQKID